jgi:hypothetical protein
MEDMQGSLHEPLVPKNNKKRLMDIEMTNMANSLRSDEPVSLDRHVLEGGESNRSAYLSRQAVQGLILVAGLGSFVLGAIIEVSADNVFAEQASKLYHFDDLVTGLLQVTGLIIATSADIDADGWARTNPRQIIVLLLMWLCYLGIEMITTAINRTIPFDPLRQVFWLPVLPAMYVLTELACEYYASVENTWRRNKRHFTKLFSLTIASDLIARGLYNILIGACRPSYGQAGGNGGEHGVTVDKAERWPSWPYFVYGFYEIIGSVAMAVAFRWSPWKEYTGRMNLTMRMHMAIYAFLFVKGTQYVISCFLDHFFINNGVVSIYQWFYGPIYVFPTAFFLWYHNRIKRKLGRGVFVVLSVILSVFLLLRGVFCPDLVSIASAR